MPVYSAATERLLHEIHITCDSLEILKKTDDGGTTSISLHEGVIRDTYPHFMNMIGGLMLEPAMKAGFKLPAKGFKLSNIPQFSDYLAKQAGTGYIVKVKNLTMVAPQIELARDTMSHIAKSNVDLTAAFWGGDANPFAKAWAATLKNTMDTQQETYDASRMIKEAEYDLSQFAKEMAGWTQGVETWLEMMAPTNA